MTGFEGERKENSPGTVFSESADEKIKRNTPYHARWMLSG